MAECVVSDVVERVLGHLGQEMAPYFGGKNNLKKAKSTLLEIQPLVSNAEMRADDDGFSGRAMFILKRLKRLLYEMEDLLEEVMQEDGIPFPGSKSCRFKIKWQLAQRCQELAAIFDEMKNTNDFGEHLARRVRPNETCSYVSAGDIVGRDKDKEDIIRMLLNSSDRDPVAENGFSVMAIVGMGGLGKTALAQLVFNDETVENNFHFRGWVYASNIFDLDALLWKILSSITHADVDQLSTGQLRIRLADALTDTKFLLVLDDVCNENPHYWLCLRDCIPEGEQGSKILVTTRSIRAAKALDPQGLIHDLQPLSETAAWNLFTRCAFRKQPEESDPTLTIGKQIAESCAGIPLALRAVGFLLSCRHLSSWKIMLNSGLGSERRYDDLFQYIKLSYTQLSSHMKSCFAYCSLFPKDYEFNKSDLIYLWMAQGFIKPLNENHQTSEEVGHEYFMILLQRSFFQVAERDENGEVISCKMHNMMHELALSVGKTECLSVVENQPLPNTENMLHVSFVINSSWEPPSWLLGAKQLRSLLLFPNDSDRPITVLNIHKLFSSLKRLRALVLDKADCENLASYIGQLKHLRYLKLSGPLEVPLSSIKRLHHFQTLHQRGQYVKFPVKNNLKYRKFVVDESAGLKELISVQNKDVRKLEIQFKRRHAKTSSEAKDVDFKSIRVTDLVLEWLSSYGEPGVRSENAEDELLHFLQPSNSVHSISVCFWKGVTFPSWGMNDFRNDNFHNLVSIEIKGCSRCHHLPSFSRLPCLKYLRLLNLKSLEYVEIVVNDNEAPSAAYFKSLESLNLEELPKLKEWRIVKSQQDSLLRLSFPCLSKLSVYLCPRLMSMPHTPKLESLRVEEIHTELVRKLTCPLSLTNDALRELQIASVQHESLSIDPSLHMSLQIRSCELLVDLKVASLMFLHQLEVYNCARLRDIIGTFDKFQKMKELKLWRCEGLNLWGMMDEDSAAVDHRASSSSSRPMDWQDLKGLRLLTIGCIMKLESLPKDLDCLTALQELKIFQLRNLKGLPEWLGCLTQLRQLEIVECPNMRTLFIESDDEQDYCRINLPSLTIRIERCRELLELFEGNAPSFKCLEVRRCARLKSISNAEIDIKELAVDYCEELPLWEDEEGNSVSTSAGPAWQSLKRLSSLTLERIWKLKSLPKSLGWLEMLRKLMICQLHNLVTLPLPIGHLAQLHLLDIVDCSKLSTISIFPAPAPVGAVESATEVNHNQLSLTLRIERCPELINIFVESPTTLQNFEIRKCGSIKEISGKELAIEKLAIEDCDELHLWNDQADTSNSSGCSSSEIVAASAWQALKSLRSLTLSNILKLVSLPRALQSAKLLEELEIIKLSNVSSLPEWIGQLTQLDRLDIRECPKLTALPDSLSQLTNLRRLLIRGCNQELNSRCQPPDGQDWPKIQHIPEASVA